MPIHYVGLKNYQMGIVKIRIVGMIPVYNELDIIEQIILHLIKEGIHLVILDSSTDGSFKKCSKYLGKGVLSIEKFPNKEFELQLILQKLYKLALKQNPDWILLNDADEFVESPYDGLTLKESIELEDHKGYNLIQFNNFEFWPTEKDQDSAEKDIRKRFKYYTWNDDYRFRAWKVYPGTVIHTTAGHYPKFPVDIDYKVSPNKFILRHYKFRSYEHGLKKVFDERLQRYSQKEFKKGWHIHYAKFGKDKKYFVIDSSKLSEYKENGDWNLARTFDGYFGACDTSSTVSIFLNENKHHEHGIILLQQENMRMKNSICERVKSRIYNIFTKTRSILINVRFKPNL